MSIRTITACILFLLSFLFVLSSQVRAATYNIPAGDVLELLIAIDAANANPGYDKIVLAADSTYTIWVTRFSCSTGSS